MVDTKPLRLLSLDSVSCDLSNGKHEYDFEKKDSDYFVGRDKASDIVIEDKRCSRKQASLSWDGSALCVTPIGTNPCFVCSPSDSVPKSLPKNKATTVKHNEKICFLALEFPFLVQYPGKPSLNNEEDMEDEIISEEEESEEDERPHCKFGVECYRGNPDHIRKFYHPHKDKHGNPRSSNDKKKNNKQQPPSDDSEEDMDIEIDISDSDSAEEIPKETENEAPKVKNVKSIPAGPRIIAEEDEEFLAETKREVNKQIAEKQAKTFKQNVKPRKIEVSRPKETTEKKKEEPEQEETKAMKNSEYPHSDLLYSLLFPPLCIDSSSQYDISKASKIMAKEILKFLHTNSETKEIRLALVDDPETPCGELVTKNLKILYEKNNLPIDTRFTVITENRESEEMTKFDSVTQQRFVVCPITWRFKPNHHISRTIFKNRKETKAVVQKQVKEKYQTAKTGETYHVLLPDLYNNTQVLLLVNGPNIKNSRKPNCLQGDYTKGSAQLETCYSSLFKRFTSLCGIED